MLEPLVVADRASRRFGKGESARVALQEVTCEVHSDDRIAVIGRSGSGKSTLLHLLSGLDRPSSGSVTWPAMGGRESLHPRLVSDIFQGPSLLPPLTVLQNVLLPLTFGRVDAAEAKWRATEALTAFGVDHLQDKLPEELSGGQAQRVSIARAVVVRPKLILADEPTGQLDTVTARTVLDTLFALLPRYATTIVIATHDPALTARCREVWTMNDGILATASNPANIDAAAWTAAAGAT
jgi:lipoprotein-releasing system ATP-binding protein